jgi:uncharacterized lipoprotein YddW (UPF0748 family)
MKKNLTILLILFTLGSYAQKPIMLWMDATANFARLSTIDSVKYYLQKCKEVGVTDIVIDVKPITGEVLYESKIAPVMHEWKGFTRNKNFDFLETAIEEGHTLNLKVHASINVFSGGHSQFKRGIIYNNHADWQSKLYTDSGIVDISSVKTKVSGMLNPANPDVQKYELAILNELLKKYKKLDGIILDRVRYDGMEADFSDLSKKLFEKYIGKKVQHFPIDIFSYRKGEKKLIKVPGILYKEWLEWRSSVIYNFFKQARTVAKAANSKIIFGDYTGAWYPTYYEVGVNWASNKYDVQKDYPTWATKKYQQYGYAELLDLYSSGCYFYEVTKQEVTEANTIKAARTEAGMSDQKAPWYSVEGSAEMAMKITMGAAPLLGSIYVDQYKMDKVQCAKAMQMCLDKTNGLMIFDMVHIVERDWWDAIKNLQKS